MIVQCERCGEDINTEAQRFRLVPAGAGLFHITCMSHTTSRSGEVLPTNATSADHESRSKQGGH